MKLSSLRFFPILLLLESLPPEELRMRTEGLLIKHGQNPHYTKILRTRRRALYHNNIVLQSLPKQRWKQARVIGTSLHTIKMEVNVSPVQHDGRLSDFLLVCLLLFIYLFIYLFVFCSDLLFKTWYKLSKKPFHRVCESASQADIEASTRLKSGGREILTISYLLRSFSAFSTLLF